MAQKSYLPLIHPPHDTESVLPSFKIQHSTKNPLKLTKKIREKSWRKESVYPSYKILLQIKNPRVFREEIRENFGPD